MCPKLTPISPLPSPPPPTGMMIGEFHASNNASGLRNDNFFPLRTPYPCLVMRYMVPGDFAFMSLDAYPVEMRRKLLVGFLEVFGDDDKPQVGMAKEELARVDKILAGEGRES